MKSFLLFLLCATLCYGAAAQCAAPVITASGSTTLCPGGSVTLSAPASNVWTKKADFGGTARFYATGFSIGSKGYIGTGSGSSGTTKDFWEYDPATNVWTQKADFGGGARSGAAGFSIGSKGYIGTGVGSRYYKDFWEYDPATNVWTQKADFGGTARYGATGFSIGNKGYIGTGNTGGSDIKDFWEYDPATNVWTQKADFGGMARYGATGFSIGSKGYIGTGTDYNGKYKDFWEYNPATNLWTQKADFGGTARFFATGFSIGSKGYMGTGFNDETVLKDFWEYDPSTNVWVQRSDFGGTARYAATGFSIGSKGYIGTGSNAGGIDNNTKDFWEFDPGYTYSWTPGGQTTSSVTVSASGNYTVTTTNGAGCSATSATTVVTVNTPVTPVISASGSTTLCPGSSVTLSAPASNVWTQKADFGGTTRFLAAGFSIGSKGYIGTGGGGGNYYKDFWEYDPATNVWTQKADFGGAGRNGATGFSIGSKGYIGTGGSSTYYKDFWEYDPSTNAWTQKADFGGTARYAATGFSIGSKGYIGTGYYGGTVYKDFWEYDPSTNVWTQKADFGGVERYHATGFSIGSKGYIGTGGSNSANADYKDFWEYDPSTNVWTQKADFGGAARVEATGFSIGSKGYIGTGNGSTGTNYTDFWEYDPATNAWAQRADFGGGARYRSTGFAIGSKGYIGTGITGILTKDFWEYDPSYSYAWTPGGQTTASITATAAGNYTVTTTNGAGCSATSAAIVVTANPVPATPLITASGSTTLCPGSSVTLSAPASNAWTQKADFGGVERYYAVGFSIGSKEYIGTGRNGSSTYYKDFWEFDPSTNVWTQKADFGGTERYYATGFSIGSKGYIGTGYNVGSLKDFWEYDPSTNVWTRKADFGGAATYGAAGFSIGSKGYIGTGGGGGKDFWEFDPSTNVWTRKADFGGAARYYATGFSIGSKGYIGTGRTADDNILSKDFWEYDPATNAWTQKADFGGAGRNNAIGFSIGSKGYIGTGGSGGLTKDFWEYNPSTNVWTQKADFGGAARVGAAGFSIGSKGYIGTGFDGSGYTKDFREYDPGYSYAWNPGGQTTSSVTASTAGNYTVTTTNALGCSATSAPTTVTTTTAPLITASGSTTICPGGSVTLSAPASNVWAGKADFGGTVRFDAAGFSIGNKGYIGTGNTGSSGVTKDFWEYDPATNVWTQKADFGGGARSDAAGFSIGNKGYIGTGNTGSSGVTKDFWEYDPATNAWTQKADFGGTARYGATGFSIGSKGYIGTGSGSSVTKDFWEYDPATNVWTQKAGFGGTARSGAAGFSIGSKGYIGTGVGSSYYKDFWEYDPANNVWTQKADFGGTARFGAAGFSIGSKGYIGTGVGITVYRDFWEYDPSTNVWVQRSDFGGTARYAAAGFSIGSKGYIGTGSNGNGIDNNTKDFWEYDPGYTYAWSSGQTTSSIAATAGSYTVTTTNALGCTVTSAATTITAATPAAPLITASGATTLCAGGSVTLSAPASNVWTQKADFGGAIRYGAAGFSIGNKGYIGIGYNGSSYKDFWAYDPATGVWTQKADFGGTARYGAAGFSIGSKGYIGTGYNGSSYTKDFWEYDPATNAWTRKADFGGVERYNAVGFSIGSKGYVGTGLGSGYLKDFWEYDPATDVWIQRADFGGTARVGAAGFSTGSKGYIGTGTGSSGSTKDFWEFNPSTNAWTQKADFGGAARFGATGFSIGSKGYVGTGNIGSYTKDFWEYDPSANVWTQKTDLGGVTRQYATGFSIGSKGYIGTGNGSSGTGVKDFWEYDPGYTYSWTPGGQTTSSVTATTTGNYIVTTTNALGCSATSVATKVSIYPAGTVYVDSSQTTSGDGSSWATAFKELRDAVSAAAQCTSITMINVAKGTYKPTNDANRDSAFAILRGGLKIYGGYPTGGGTRNVTANPTILSGDIGTANTSADNSYHVIVIAGLTSGADSLVIDGFTVTNAYANGSGSTTYAGITAYRNEGGGIYLQSNNGAGGKIAIRNCVLSNNTVTEWGGGVYNQLSSPTLINCAFTANTARNAAGIFNYNSSSPAITNCVFTGNIATQDGGAIHNRLSSSPVITNCTLFSNSASASGAGIYNNGSSPLISNSVIWGNTGNYPGIYADNSTPTVTYSDVQGGYAGTGNINADPLFVNPADADGTDNIFGTADDGLQITCASPANNTGTATNAPSTDIIGTSRPVGSGIDMGAYEQTATITTPVITASGSTAICSGSTVTLSSSAAATYQWYKDGTAIASATLQSYTASSAGAYTVLVTNTAGCSATSAAIVVTVNPVPATPLITASGSTTLCPGGSVTLSAPASNVWTQKADFGGAARLYATGFSIGSKGYIGTGTSNSSSNGNLKDFWEYDPASNVWTQKADFGGAARYNATGFSIGSKGYIGTGYGGSNIYYKDFWEYDPSTNVWTQKADFGGAARAYATGFSISSKGYIGTGYSGSIGYLKDFWQYDPSTDAWTQKADFGGGVRSSATGFSIGSKGYVGTGNTSSNYYRDFWEYDPAGNVWTQKADFGGTARRYATGFSIGSKGYIGMGIISSPYKDFWEYNPATNVWTQKADINSGARFAATGFSIGSKGYIGAGSNSSAYLKDFREYDPGYTYSWSPGGQTTSSITVTTSGSYTVTTTNVLGCSATSAAVTITAYKSDNGAIYVDNNVAASGDGASWTTAYKELREALNAASQCSSITTINVAKGTYKPTNDANRDSAFTILRGGLKIYGGYPTGGGTRNILANPTILSGDIGNLNDSTDNSYHVIIVANPGINADSLVIDGFTITKANANGGGGKTYNGVSVLQNSGGGMAIANQVNSSTVIRNCIITGNTAITGAGIGSKSNASPTFISCTFSTNKSASEGGAIYHSFGGKLTLRSCIFQNNSATRGGAMRMVYGDNSLTATGNTFYLNTASSNDGGALSLVTGNGKDTLINNLFVQNKAFGSTADNGGGALVQESGTSTYIVNNTFYADSAASNGGAIRFKSGGSNRYVYNNIFYKSYNGSTNTDVSLESGTTITAQSNNLYSSTNPLFINEASPAGSDNLFGTSDDGLRLQIASPAQNTGSNAAVPAGITTDIKGDARISNCTVDMGAYEVIDNANLYWTGLVSNDWQTAGNWCGGVPAPAASVVIPVSAPYPPRLSSSVTLGNLLIATGTSLSLNDNTLTINGALSGTGVMTGSPTSSLVINGSGGAGTLYFDPSADGTTNVLNNMTMNRASGTTTLGNKLNLTGIYTPTSGVLNSNGYLNLKSSVGGTAGVAQGSSSGGYITGNVTVERYTDGGNPASQNNAGGRRAWRLLSAPVTGVTIHDAWQERAQNSSDNPLPGYGTKITGQKLDQVTAESLGFDYIGAGNNTSIKQFDVIVTGSGTTTTNTWDPIPQTPGTGTKGITFGVNSRQAYMLFVRGDRTVGATGQKLTTLRAAGLLRQGEQPVTVSPGTFTLAGNPYAAVLDFSKLIAHNNTGAGAIRDQFSMWNSKLGDYGAYVLVSRSSASSPYEATPSPLTGTGTVTGDTYKYIPSGAGFFITPVTPNFNTSPGTITIQESDKASAGSQPPVSPFREVNSQTVRQLLVNLNLKGDTSSQLADGFRALFSDDYSGYEEESSSEKTWNFNENLNLIRNGRYHIIEARGEVKAADTLFMQMWNVSKRKYELQMRADNFATSPGIRAWLADRYLGTRQELSLAGDVMTLGFEVNGDSLSSKTDRFMIVFQNVSATTVLPVTLTSVKAAPVNEGVSVNWTVRSEVNMKGYTVQRSAVGGRTYTDIATQPAKNGTGAAVTSYSSYDVQPDKGENLYRIRMEAKDAAVSYSQSVEVTIGEGAGIAMTVYPNPATTKATVHINNITDDMSIVLTDSKGSIVWEKNNIANTDTSIPVAHFANGTYLVTIKDKKGMTKTMKLVKAD